MRKFIFKVLTFCILFFSSLVVISVIYENIEIESNDYIKGMIKKHQLLDSIPSPRIIIAGGSNNAFGINSRLIEEAFELPVINLSIHAGLGTPFIIEEIQQGVRNNDIVILSLEYGLRDGDKFIKKVLPILPEIKGYAKNYFDSNFLLNIQSNVDHVSGKILQHLIMTLKNSLSQSNGIEVSEIYHMNAFNKYGDVVAHIHEKSKLKKAQKNDDLKDNSVNDNTEIENDKYFKLINNFKEVADSKGANVIFMFPTMAESYYEINSEGLKMYAEDIKKKVNIDIGNDTRSFVYKDSLYYDTPSHLTGIGRDLRTIDLIKLLKKNTLLFNDDNDIPSNKKINIVD